MGVVGGGDGSEEEVVLGLGGGRAVVWRGRGGERVRDCVPVRRNSLVY